MAQNVRSDHLLAALASAETFRRNPAAGSMLRTFLESLYVFLAVVAALAVFWIVRRAMSGGWNRLRRRLSFASTVQSRPDLWRRLFGSDQQIITVHLVFEKDDAPTREETLEMGRAFMRRLVRMRSVPEDVPPQCCQRGGGGVREWVEVSDVEAALDAIVTEVELTEDTPDGARRMLEVLKSEQIKAWVGDVQTPLWRFHLLGRRGLVLRIDHAIGDGLSLATLFSLIGTVGPDGRFLSLSEVSPMMKRIKQAGDCGVLALKLSLLWPPKFFRAVRRLTMAIRSKKEETNPLLPPGYPRKIEEIPPANFATVYFPPLPLSLFKTLAHCAEKSITVNDVIVACMGDAVQRYFREIGYNSTPDQEFLHVALPVGFPKRPSLYLDEYRGLSLQYAPVLSTLWLKPLPVVERLRRTHHELKEIKDSNVAALITVLVDCMGLFITPEQFVNMIQNGLGTASLALTNVPGPDMPVYFAGHKMTEVQLLVTNPFCNVQVMSYNGAVYVNSQVDTRSTVCVEKLVEAFEGSIRAVIEELPMESEDREANLRILERASDGHKPGPFSLSPV